MTTLKWNSRNWIFSLILPALILAGCAGNFQPVATPGVYIENDWAVIQTDSCRISVSWKYWLKEPQDLNDNSTTVYLRVRNLGRDKLRLAITDVHLVDDNDRQYDPIVYQNLIPMLLPDLGMPPRPGMTRSEREQWERRQSEGQKNLIQQSFEYGVIVPNAVKDGYVFFPNIPSNTQRFRLIVLGHSIPFARSQ